MVHAARLRIAYLVLFLLVTRQTKVLTMRRVRNRVIYMFVNSPTYAGLSNYDLTQIKSTYY